MGVAKIDTMDYLKLIEKVERYVHDKNESFAWGSFVTIRQVARRFRIRQRDVITICEDSDNIDYNIGIMLQGFGYHVEKRIGDYTVEWTGELNDKRNQF